MVPEDFDSEEKSTAETLEGVGGWLLALCVILTIIVPFVGAHVLVYNYQKASSDFEYVPGLQEFMFVNTAIRFFLVVFAMHTGIGLWTERPNAVRTAKIYLFTFLGGLALGVSLLFIMVDWTPEALEIIVPEAIKEVCASLVFFVTCFLYLVRSKRVKATYGE